MNPGSKVPIGIVGASGYTGCELARLLGGHPAAEVVFATADSQAGRSLAALYPTAPDLPMIPTAEAPFAQAEVVFLCLPHGAAASTAVAALEAGCRVIDLSADFRLRDAATYATWYGAPHPAPALLGEAIYGLTERARAALPAARLVANPGCYPTSVLLALTPLLTAGVTLRSPLIADSKSGVSGAGRTPSQTTHFVEVSENLSPYKVGRAHRHLPEMEQELSAAASDAPPLVFTPHLVPIARGMLSTIYVTPEAALSAEAIHGLLTETYGAEPFVKVLPLGQPATFAHAVRTNRCAIGVTAAGATTVITSAIDNLLKGAAGQAVQNLNAMIGQPETAGLPL